MECTTVAKAQAKVPSMHYVVRMFFENTKHRFGEVSSQVVTINQVLHDFQTMKIPKRHALSAILTVLRDHEDLRQDLMNVLHHRDARWGVGDFEFGSTLNQTIPQFLQPIHQPQLRLPSSWNLDHNSHLTIHPAVLNESSESHTHEPHYCQGPLNTQQGIWSSNPHSISSPVSQGSAYSHFSNHPTLPMLDYASKKLPSVISQVLNDSLSSPRMPVATSGEDILATDFEE